MWTNGGFRKLFTKALLTEKRGRKDVDIDTQTLSSRYRDADAKIQKQTETQRCSYNDADAKLQIQICTR